MTKWTALVLAGSRPGVDPFAVSHGTDLKALIPVAGEPMIRRPVRALLDASDIASVRVLTQQPERIGAVLPADPRLTVEMSEATIAATLAPICTDSGTQWPILVTTADHALLNDAMITDFIARAKGADLAIALVEARPLLARLPHAKRTWIGFRGGRYSGANMFALGSPRAAKAIDLWRTVEQDRKKGWKLLATFGLPGLLGLLRLRSLHQTTTSIGRRLGLDLRAIEMRDPLAAVDVDKPADYQLVEAILAGRA
jgi:GTP:adenosylcobinamide-phosphate guanylyltransferase